MKIVMDFVVVVAAAAAAAAIIVYDINAVFNFQRWQVIWAKL